VKYLRARPGDAARATVTMKPPSDAARELLANGGVEPALLPATTLTGTVTEIAETGVGATP
jgi:hypothetical protein